METLVQVKGVQVLDAAGSHQSRYKHLGTGVRPHLCHNDLTSCEPNVFLGFFHTYPAHSPMEDLGRYRVSSDEDGY